MVIGQVGTYGKILWEKKGLWNHASNKIVYDYSSIYLQHSVIKIYLKWIPRTEAEKYWYVVFTTKRFVLYRKDSDKKT